MTAPRVSTPPTTARKGFIINWEIGLPRVNKSGFSCAQAVHNAAESQSLLAIHKCTESQDTYYQEHGTEQSLEDRALHN